MAIEYDLEFGDPATEELLATTFIDCGTRGQTIPPGRGVDHLRGDGLLLTSGLYCLVTTVDVSSIPAANPLTTSFGITPTCSAYFRMHLGQHEEWQVQQMVWMASALLARLPGDAALHFQYEVMWLMRKDGRQYVSDRDDLWPPDRLGLLGLPFERAAMRFSGMPEG